MKRLLLALLLVSCEAEEPPKGICLMTEDEDEVWFQECDVATDEYCQFVSNGNTVRVVEPYLEYFTEEECQLFNLWKQLLERVE